MTVRPHRLGNTGRIIITAAIALIALLYGSCQVGQEVHINKDGSGRVEFDIQLAPYFTEVADQLQKIVPPEEGEEIAEGQNIFRVEQLRSDFAEKEEVQLEELSSPNPQELHGLFRFTSIERALTREKKELESGELFSFSQSGGVSTLRVLVNYETFDALLDANPSFNTPLMENFGPPANRGLSEKEYLDMMEYALGKESRRGIKESVLKLSVEVDGTITSHEGGTLESDRRVVFRVPLLDILILDEAVELAVSFK
jgi:hypothetical protein